MTTYTSTAERIEEHRKTARTHRRRAKSAAQRAERYYQVSRDWLIHAAWLTKRPDMWSADSDPAAFERLAHTYVRIGDLYLGSSFHSTELMHTYYDMANRLVRRNSANAHGTA